MSRNKQEEIAKIVWYVRRNPGEYKAQVARGAKSLTWFVDRAIDEGLIDSGFSDGMYHLTVKDPAPAPAAPGNRIRSNGVVDTRPNALRERGHGWRDHGTENGGKNHFCTCGFEEGFFTLAETQTLARDAHRAHLHEVQA